LLLFDIYVDDAFTRTSDLFLGVEEGEGMGMAE
jgi:hypothetical protein